MRRRAPIAIWLIVIFFGARFLFASGTEKSATKPYPSSNAAADQSFSAFQEIDALLTKLDHDSQQLRSQREDIIKLPTRHQRELALRKLRRSPSFKEAMHVSRKLVVLSRHEEALYAKKRQRYGRILFRELDRRAAGMQAVMARQENQLTVSDFTRQEEKFRGQLLAFVLQFQAISGGYAALACDPGGWTCCQPRTVMGNGKTQIKGCTWRCASKVKACSGGCLGPRVPNIAAAIEVNKPKVTSAPAHTTAKPGAME